MTKKKKKILIILKQMLACYYMRFMYECIAYPNIVKTSKPPICRQDFPKNLMAKKGQLFRKKHVPLPISPWLPSRSRQRVVSRFFREVGRASGAGALRVASSGFIGFCLVSEVIGH